MTTKKVFPKLKTKIKNFLANESGKITKKDALGLAAWGALFAAAESVSALGQVPSGHANHAAWGHSSVALSSPTWFACTANTPAAVHASWVINGHYSGNVTSPTPSAYLSDNTGNGEVTFPL